MDNKKQEFENFLDNVRKAKAISIFRHINPDGDALGSQWAMYHFIKDNFPDKKVYCLGRKTKANIQNLFPMPDVVDDKKLGKTFAIIMDTPNSDRVDDQRFKNTRSQIMFDHHPKQEDFVKHSMIEEKAPATCEMLARYFFDSKLTVSKQTAQCLYVGILTDTGRLSYGQVSPNTFTIVKNLISKGVDISTVNRQLSAKTLKKAKYEGYVLSKVKYHKNVAYIIVPKNKNEKFGLTFDEAGSNVNLISNIQGCDIAVYST